MKKLILGITALVSLFSISQGYEANIKVGYDFFRDSTLLTDSNGNKEVSNEIYERGFILGLELLPLTFNDSKIKLGTGVEYNFGETKLHYSKNSDSSEHGGKDYIPLYATAKFTYYKDKKSDLNLYTFTRLGYAFSKEKKDNAKLSTDGVYYGLGFGLDYKYFLAELIYDGSYSDLRGQNCPGLIYPVVGVVKSATQSFHHKVGVRLGLQLGTQHFPKPQIQVPKIIEKIVEVPKIVEVEKIVEVQKKPEQKPIQVPKKPSPKKPTPNRRKPKKKNGNSDVVKICRWVKIEKR